jgi:hypothetical protein
MFEQRRDPLGGFLRMMNCMLQPMDSDDYRQAHAARQTGAKDQHRGQHGDPSPSRSGRVQLIYGCG